MSNKTKNIPLTEEEINILIRCIECNYIGASSELYRGEVTTEEFVKFSKSLISLKEHIQSHIDK